MAYTREQRQAAYKRGVEAKQIRIKAIAKKLEALQTDLDNAHALGFKNLPFERLVKKNEEIAELLLEKDPVEKLSKRSFTKAKQEKLLSTLTALEAVEIDAVDLKEAQAQFIENAKRRNASYAGQIASLNVEEFATFRTILNTIYDFGVGEWYASEEIIQAALSWSKDYTVDEALNELIPKLIEVEQEQMATGEALDINKARRKLSRTIKKRRK